MALNTITVNNQTISLSHKLNVYDDMSSTINISTISNLYGQESNAGGGGAILQKNDGSSYNVPYAEKITVNSGTHILIYYFSIKKCRKVKLFFRYQCNYDIVAKPFLQGENGWINNAGVTKYNLIMHATSGMSDFVCVERDWLSDAIYFVPYFMTGNNASITSLPVGTELIIADTYLVLEDFVQIDIQSKAHTITVAPSGGNFTSVRDAVESITDNTSSNKYDIIVKNGTYNEIDIFTKDYVNIIGESREGVILYCNGLSTENAPNNYHGGSSYSGTPINTIPKAAKHLFIHNSNSTLKNMTFKINNVKYVIHQDGTNNEYEAFVENCTFIRDENCLSNNSDYEQQLYNLVGVGAKGGQYQRYIDCDFIMKYYNVPEYLQPHLNTLFWHNWDSQNKPAGATFKNLRVFGASFASFTELASLQNDIIEISGCSVDSKYHGISYSVSGSLSSEIAYCIKLNIINSNIPYVFLDKRRQYGIEYVYDPYSTTIMQVSENILFGQPVQLKTMGGKTGIAQFGEFGFAVQTVNANEMCYINTGSVGNALCVAGTYNQGDAAYISNGKFTNIQTGEQVGRFVSSGTINSDDLLTIQKL